jgi:hypothetical protein
VTGFDDCGETVLDDDLSEDPVISFLEELATGFFPFYILRPPEKISWMLQGTSHDTSLPVVSRLSSNRVPVKAVDLDPYMIGDVAVAMIFPASDDTMRLFSEASRPVDDNLNLLRRIPNVHMIRFVEPANIHVQET